MTMRFPQGVLWLAAVWACSAARGADAVSGAAAVDFNRDIRPIFSAHCTSCHGGVKAAGGVSFVYEDKVLGKAKSGRAPVVPGNPEASELFKRITSSDPDQIMPKPGKDRPPLSADEIGKIKAWIASGAKWGEHWAFVPPVEPPAPFVHHAGWAKSKADALVLAKMESEGVSPSLAASPAQWLRRVSLDLTGLPPTLEDYQSFKQEYETCPTTASEHVVDRLLASPAYGERWASVWLDLARYADTYGFEKDPHRNIWPWRDWVIRAFNADMPFDQFTIKQLAGDLLQNPSADDLLATAFHRNTQNNTEGGTSDEEWRTAAVLDRVNTTWTAWQATTFGCTQCHSHPYDPFPQRDYYRFVALFDNTEDADLDDDFPRMLVADDQSKREEAAKLSQELKKLREAVNAEGLRLCETSRAGASPVGSASADAMCATSAPSRTPAIPSAKADPTEAGASFTLAHVLGGEGWVRGGTSKTAECREALTLDPSPQPSPLGTGERGQEPSSTTSRTPAIPSAKADPTAPCEPAAFTPLIPTDVQTTAGTLDIQSVGSASADAILATSAPSRTPAIPSAKADPTEAGASYTLAHVLGGEGWVRGRASNGAECRESLTLGPSPQPAPLGTGERGQDISSTPSRQPKSVGSASADATSATSAPSRTPAIPSAKADPTAPCEPAAFTPLIPTDVQTTAGTLDIQPGGRMQAGGTLNIGVTYTVKVPAVPGLSAFRLTIYPDSTDPKKWPERGAVISKLDATLVLADGRRLPVKLKEVFADYLAGPFEPQNMIAGGGGFGGYPSLSGARWCIVTLEKPLADIPDDDDGYELSLSGASLELALKQGAVANAGAQACPLRQFDVAASVDPRWTALVNGAKHQQKWDQIRTLRAKLAKIAGTKVPVMQDRTAAAARDTRIFIRGNRLAKDESVEPGLPALFHASPKPGRMTRLDLARWLVSDENPLAARVLANRLWAEMFGRGIVETLEDFGTSGQRPGNPELLDHLALRLSHDDHWSIKTFLRDIALSSAYWQSSRATPALAQRDPANVLLARGPRVRLTAEMVRDQALVLGGMLSSKQFGPPVYPPQPDGIWRSMYSGAKWKTSTGEDRYRRAIYTYCKRTAGYPAYLTFDAPTRDACTPRRVATNTPLQALVTLNDPAFIELAQAYAKRMAETSLDPREQIARGLKLITLDDPAPAMVDALMHLYDEALEEYRRDPSLSAKLAKTPESAALALVANALMNLDIALTR